jgi:uncharacterized membrane protein YhaH (DUF805 family)
MPTPISDIHISTKLTTALDNARRWDDAAKDWLIALLFIVFAIGIGLGIAINHRVESQQRIEVRK